MERVVIISVLLFAFVACEYRSIDGTGNNLANPNWGSNGQMFNRPDLSHQYFYADNVSVPRGGMPSNLPNERVIHQTIIMGQGSAEEGLSSDWAWVVGEFLAFELVKTTGNTSEPIPITITNTSDPLYSINNGSLPFSRCVHSAASGTDPSNPRVQTNGASAWLDAQTIYGETAQLASWNRNFTGGLLRYVDGPDGEFPPLIGSDPNIAVSAFFNPTGNVDTSQLFILGSPRVNQQPQSMCLNIMWRREHNRIARWLSARNSSMDDETLYQEARRRVIALMQHFYEDEYIPMLLGTPNLAPYRGYNSSVDPNIDFMFNTVALRYGHTQVNEITWRLNEDGSFASGGNISLKNSFFQPAILSNGGCSPIWRGLNAKQHNSPEVNLVDTLQDFLFAKAGQTGNDLIATNMRRAREVGLPNYNTARMLYGLTPQPDFSFTVWRTNFEKAYGTTDPTNCDPWMCGLFEPGFGDGELGELFYTIVKRQIERTRDSDRFWYLNNQFSPEELAEIKKTRMTDILLRNGNIQNLKCSFFEVPGNEGSNGPMCMRGTATNTTTPLTVTTITINPTTGSATTGSATTGVAGTGSTQAHVSTDTSSASIMSICALLVLAAFLIM